MCATGNGPSETSERAALRGPTGLTGAAASRAGAQRRSHLVAIRTFTRHLLEMIVAMLVGMAALVLALAVLGEPPGYDHPLVECGLMGAAMAAPMVAWMRYRGHPWSDGAEMTAAMLLPTLALVGPAALGLLRADGHLLMMLAHVAMFAGMVALMLCRRDRYTHGSHRRRA